MADENAFLLLFPVLGRGDHDGANALAARSVQAASGWYVCKAEPFPGDLHARSISEAEFHEGDDMLPAAVEDFFGRMRTSGLPGLIDTAEARIRGMDPFEICQSATDAIIEDIPEVDDPEMRVDDFESHPLADLREVLVENCPEFSGESPGPQGF